MKFSEIVAATREWLQREGRVSYRALKREFECPDEILEELKEELIDIQEIAVEKDGKMLVWTGGTPVPSSEFQVPSSTQSLASTSQSPDSELRTPNSELRTPNSPP